MEPTQDPRYPLSEETVTLFQRELEQARRLREYYNERENELREHLHRSAEARLAQTRGAVCNGKNDGTCPKHPEVN